MDEADSRKKQLQQFYTNKEYQAKFMLTPDIESEADYDHLDKNLAITNLRFNKKQGIDEPERARSILDGLHVLNNPIYFEDEKRKVTGYDKDGKLVTKIVTVKVSIFPKTFHNLKSKFYSLVNTSAATNGHRVRAAITNRLEREDSLNDKTVAPKTFFKRK